MSKIQLAIVSGNGFAETFTKAHVDHLKPKYQLTGGIPPRMLNGRPVIQLSFFKRLQNKIKPDPRLQQRDFPFRYFLQKYKPSVMIIEYGNDAAQLIAIANEFKVPVIACFYGYDAFRYEVLSRLKKEYQVLFTSAKFICTQSQSIARELIAMGCPERKIVVNPAPPATFFADAQCNYQSNSFVAVGRFVEKKAPLQTIKAFAKLLAQRPEAKLLFAGDGELLEEGKRLAADLNCLSAVNFKGRISQEEQLKLFNDSFCFVQHSITASDGDQEGLPVSIMEAVMTGMPVVSTIHSGIPEVVENNYNGFLVNENDVDAMASAMIRLYDDRLMVEEFGKKGKARILAAFTMEKHISKLKELIEKSVSSE